MPDPSGETERDRIIREKLEERLEQERGRLSNLFPPSAELTFDKNTGYWNANFGFDKEDALGGQKITCSLRSGSPYSRAGILGGFRLNHLTVNGQILYDQSSDDFDFSFVPSPPEVESQPEFAKLLDEEVMVFDPNTGEVLSHALNKPEHLVGALHEISHGRLNREVWRDINEHYEAYLRLDGERSFAQERLEGGDELTDEERRQIQAQANYQVNEADMVHIRAVLEEELRANLDLLGKLSPIASLVFPNDPDLVAVRRFLSERIATYVENAKELGAGKYLFEDEEKKILKLR